MRRLVSLTLFMMALAPVPAAFAQGSPFQPLPPPAPTQPAPPPPPKQPSNNNTGSDSSGGGLGNNVELLLAGAGILLLGVIGYFIVRDARRRAPVRGAHDDERLSEARRAQARRQKQRARSARKQKRRQAQTVRRRGRR